jgi:protein Mpv17
MYIKRNVTVNSYYLRCRYVYLDKFALSVAPKGSATFLTAKVVADCLVFGPIHIAAFFTALTLSEGGNIKDVKAKLHADGLPTLAAELTVWPVIQVFNFAKVPLQYQLLVVNGVTIFDATFMSWAQHNDISKKIQALLGRP